MQNVVSIPSDLAVDELIVVGNDFGAFENGLAVTSCESVVANNHHGELCIFQLAANCVSTSLDLV